MSYAVEYYEMEDGSKPAEDFILAQDCKMQAKIFSNLTYLEAMGPKLREPYSKPLGDGIFEIRTKLGSDYSRPIFLCGRTEGNPDQWLCEEDTQNPTRRDRPGEAVSR